MSDTDQQAVLTMTIQDKSVLYGAHYVFSAKRWFTCADNETVSAGEEVLLLLTLMDEPEKLPVAARVVWITQEGTQGNRQADIGIEFSSFGQT